MRGPGQRMTPMGLADGDVRAERPAGLSRPAYPTMAMGHTGRVMRQGWADESDVSPAERFARAAAGRGFPHLAAFTLTRPFVLDRFRVDACRALEDGHGVLVCAPTGAGKTVVGEFAVHLALATGGKCFYTTPIKALSNQKFADLV